MEVVDLFVTSTTPKRGRSAVNLGTIEKGSDFVGK